MSQDAKKNSERKYGLNAEFLIEWEDTDNLFKQKVSF
jgi:hypothetical protein